MGSTVTLTDGVILRQTIGQTSGVTVLSDNEGVVLRQGFEQPEYPIASGAKPICDYTLSPNPTQTNFKFISSHLSGNFTVSVYDANGKLFKSFPNLELSTQPIDVAGWAAGMYYVQASNSSSFLCTKKLMIIQ